MPVPPSETGNREPDGSHLDDLEARTPWWVVTRVADLITATQRYPRRWGITAPTPPEQ